AEHPAAEHFVSDGRGLIFAFGDHYALAGSQSVGLYDDGSVEVRKRIANVFRRIANRIMSGGNTVALQEFLGKALAGLEPGSGLGWAECAPASSREFVDQAEHERQFGTHNCEVGLDLVRERDH